MEQQFVNYLKSNEYDGKNNKIIQDWPEIYASSLFSNDNDDYRINSESLENNNNTTTSGEFFDFVKNSIESLSSILKHPWKSQCSESEKQIIFSKTQINQLIQDSDFSSYNIQDNLTKTLISISNEHKFDIWKWPLLIKEAVGLMTLWGVKGDRPYILFIICLSIPVILQVLFPGSSIIPFIISALPAAITSYLSSQQKQKSSCSMSNYSSNFLPTTPDVEDRASLKISNSASDFAIAATATAGGGGGGGEDFKTTFELLESFMSST
jgi:hypothetical protein